MHPRAFSSSLLHKVAMPQGEGVCMGDDAANGACIIGGLCQIAEEALQSAGVVLHQQHILCADDRVETQGREQVLIPRFGVKHQVVEAASGGLLQQNGEDLRGQVFPLVRRRDCHAFDRAAIQRAGGDDLVLFHQARAETDARIIIKPVVCQKAPKPPEHDTFKRRTRVQEQIYHHLSFRLLYNIFGLM